jgi:hypothetical protein
MKKEKDPYEKLVKESIETYLKSITETKLQELIEPIIHKLVKQEFDRKIAPAVTNQIQVKTDEMESKIADQILESIREIGPNIVKSTLASLVQE